MEGTTSHAACGLIRLKTGKLTSSRHLMDHWIDSLKIDCVFVGAWPFSVRGLICQVNFGNERDFS